MKEGTTKHFKNQANKMIADYMDIILIVKQTFIVFFAEGLELGSIV